MRLTISRKRPPHLALTGLLLLLVLSMELLIMSHKQAEAKKSSSSTSSKVGKVVVKQVSKKLTGGGKHGKHKHKHSKHKESDSKGKNYDPECVWIGTAPFCAGACENGQRLITAASSKPKDSNIPYAQFGNPCWSGTKALCCPHPPPVSNDIFPSRSPSDSDDGKPIFSAKAEAEQAKDKILAIIQKNEEFWKKMQSEKKNTAEKSTAMPPPVHVEIGDILKSMEEKKLTIR